MAISAVQILAIDLIGEMGPLASLARDPARPGIMTEQPRDTSKHILRKKTIIDLIFSGFLMG
jgi:P-type Ca2+ transporter type 2C